MNKRRGLLGLLLLLGALVGLCPRGFLFPVGVLFGGGLLGLFLTVLLVPRDISFAFPVFLGAFFARVLLAVMLYAGCLLTYSELDSHNAGFFVGDGWGYSHAGAYLAAEREKGHEPNSKEMFRISRSGARSPFDYWNGAVYGFSGKSPLSLFFLSGLASSLAVLFIYLASHLLWHRAAARWAALLSAFWPSHILWGSQNLQEPFLILLVSLAFWSFLGVFLNFRFYYVGICLFSTVSAVLFRPPVGAMMLFSFSVGLLFHPKTRLFMMASILLLFLASSLLPLKILKPSPEFLRRLTYGTTSHMEETGGRQSFRLSDAIKYVNYLRRVRTQSARSKFLEDWKMETMGELLLFLPLGILYVFLSPFPWQLGGYLQVLGAYESLIFYPLLFWGIRGYVVLSKRRPRVISGLITFVIVMSIALGLFEGNVGTLFRHRCVVWPVLFIFMSVGLSIRKKTPSFSRV